MRRVEPEEILEQLAFPRVPDLRARAADVGHRQQVERDEPTFRPDDAGELADDVGIGEVPLLRDRRHGEVVLDQELDERDVLAREPVRAREAPRVDPAEPRVVAAAALGDVVEDRRDVEEPVALEVGGEPAAERVLVRELDHREPPQVAHDHQDVLVDGIHVEEVVLHLTDDLAEGGEVAAEDPVLVHAPQLVHQAPRLPQDGEESGAVRRVGPEPAVDPPPRAPERAQRGRGHPFQLGVLLQQQETLQDRVRIPPEHPWVARVEELAHRLEALVDRFRRRIGSGENRGAEVLKQGRVQLRDRLRRPEVALHEELARALRRRGREAERLRERVLIVEEDPVLAPPREQMEADAHPREPLRVALELDRLLARDELARRQRAPVAAEPACAADPEHDLQVAEAAGRLLQVRLEAVGAVLELGMPLFLLESLRLEERLCVETVMEAIVQLREDGAAARDQARLEQRGLHREVLRGLVAAFLDRAHAVPELEPDVPQPADELLHPPRLDRIERLRQKNEDVDVRMRIELAAAEAADGDERELPREVRLSPQLPEDRIDQLLVAAQEARSIGIGFVFAPERGALACEAPPQLGRVVRDLETSGGHRGHRARLL